ncbi:hypothetical protein P280DRAFT_422558 [Massarina eburnea CBS 473.64]|uniref:Saponin hydrolase n=1 Tax=Massarina eburnea CBS 473.64 TaxID=1395130 RepID=A0A6A6SBL4_9PLEO|nr:hypothetical protein P280DRAFT_422558 [Massarina eburnea CBS 473.64]
MRFPTSPTTGLASLILLPNALAVIAANIPAPPAEEPITIRELDLPPVIGSSTAGNCSTGCIGKDTGVQSGGFTPDDEHIVSIINFVAPNDTNRNYTGLQAILMKTVPGATFSNGLSWRCITCDVPTGNQVGRNKPMDYPDVFPNGTRIIAGTNIIDCSGELFTSSTCTPEKTFIRPIRWSNTADDSGTGGSMRELRMHPDGEHLGWSSQTMGGQSVFTGRLQYNDGPSTGTPLSPRYDVVDVNILYKADSSPITFDDRGNLSINNSAIDIGELRGFSGTGREVLYIGYPTESCNIDVYAIDSSTGAIRRLTNNPEYVDPVDISPDDTWTVIMDTRASHRQMFMAGMRGIPPLLDMVVTTAASSTRNNGARRFFQPWLLDQYAERGSYKGQQLNAGNTSNPSISDPNWNGRADPLWSRDGTQIIYWQTLVHAPACGASNPLPCPNSTAQGGRLDRVMLASLTSRDPVAGQEIVAWPDVVPWATKFAPGDELPAAQMPASYSPGNYTLTGRVAGFASVMLTELGTGKGIGGVHVTYFNYSDDGANVLNGNEAASVAFPSVWLNVVDWYSDITQTGAVDGRKLTTPASGFHLEIDALTNVFNATGNLTTVLDGVVYVQPGNGA